MHRLDSTDVAHKRDMVVSLFTDEAAFRGMRKAWNELAKQLERPSVFYSHEWFDAAWAWRKSSARLFIVCAYDGERLIGVMPLISESLQDGGARLRRLEFLTVPDTQVCDLMIVPDMRAEVARAFAEELARHQDSWDEVRLSYLPSVALAARELQAQLRALGLWGVRKPFARNLYVSLAGQWDSFYAGRGRRLKSHNKNAANRLRKAGNVEIQWLEPGKGSQREVDRVLEAVIGISGQSWKTETGNSLDQPGPQAFVRSLTDHAWRNGWLSVWVLKLDAKAIAMEYQLVYEGNVHALRSDFDTRREELSPGAHLNQVLLQRLFGRGLTHYYMGPGENAYKTRWTSEGEMLDEIVVYGKSLRSRLRWFLEARLKPALRPLRDVLGSLGKRSHSGDDGGKSIDRGEG